MVRKTALAIGCFLLAVSGLNAFPTGTGLSVAVSTQPFSVDGGGRFTGTVDGVFSNFWCVDAQTFIQPPATFTANVLALNGTNINSAPPADPYDVRYEDVTGTGVGGWQDAIAGGNNALFRYQMAAYLTTLFDESLGGGAAKNRAIQSSIWKAMDIDPNNVEPFATTDGVTDFYALAIAVVNAGAFDFSDFVVVSGWSSGGLADTGENQVQTFITQVPEPSFYLALGVGLAGLLTARRLRKSA